MSFQSDHALLPSGSSSCATSHGPHKDLKIREVAGNLVVGRRNVRGQEESYRHTTTINMLPSDVLLEIFDLCQKGHQPHQFPFRHVTWQWYTPAHVCQRWREIIFASPLRLNLQIFCTRGTPVRKYLSCWPAFPLVIDYGYDMSLPPSDEVDVIAALEHSDRVRLVDLLVTGSQLGKVSAVMHQPFPALTHLDLSLVGEDAPVLPDTFLGASAPSLRFMCLRGIPYPTLPTLLSSASDLVDLVLSNIPRNGYISPEAIVTGLAALDRLESLSIVFQSPASPDRIHLPPVTRTVLPSLTNFQFHGVGEYLEVLVAQIDAPRLQKIHATYYNQLSDLQIPQFVRFIGRSEDPRLALLRRAGISFQTDWAFFDMGHSSDWTPNRTCISILISCQGIDWQYSHLAQVISQFSSMFSNVVRLEIYPGDLGPQPEGTDDIEWLQLFRPFTAVRTLGVHKNFSEHVALALEDFSGETVAEVLPALDFLYLENQSASSAEKFTTARLLTGRPVTIVNTQKEFEERLES